MKRSEPPVTTATISEDAKAQAPKVAAETSAEKQGNEPPKKKRRVALTHVGQLDP